MYCIVAKCTAGDGSNMVGWRLEGSSPSYCGGNVLHTTDSGANWTAYTGQDFIFENWGDEPSVNYVLTTSVGEFALTGVNVILTKALNLITSVGSYTLTGINLIFGKGYTLVTSVGEYTLTGVNVILTKALNLITSVGAFTLTGVNITFTRLWNMSVSVGRYIITGINLVFRGWKFPEKHTSTYSEKTKTGTAYTMKTKGTTIYTYKTKQEL